MRLIRRWRGIWVNALLGNMNMDAELVCPMQLTEVRMMEDQVRQMERNHTFLSNPFCLLKYLTFLSNIEYWIRMSYCFTAICKMVERFQIFVCAPVFVTQTTVFGKVRESMQMTQAVATTAPPFSLFFSIQPLYHRNSSPVAFHNYIHFRMVHGLIPVIYLSARS